ncbi:MAG TPA: 2-hydroxychromene-2-carboxylate isomerase [Steroidobacteraceae bacterium]|nr:2-hydroxychromene-2-carboxylate isomerase [Steroidobacteraceae bacterium]
MTRADWYFDFISPFSYLQFHELRQLRELFEVRLRPVLLAGLLSHWGQLGPAEIAPKRSFIYRQVRWLARRRGVPLALPRAHPFNPLPLLRLAIHLGATEEAVERLFAFVWRDGKLPDDRAAWEQLLAELGVADAERAIGAEPVKQELRANTEAAISAGVFGVPTLVVGEMLFWGDDSTQMACDYAADPAKFLEDEARARAVPVGVMRKQPGARPGS